MIFRLCGSLCSGKSRAGAPVEAVVIVVDVNAPVTDGMPVPIPTDAVADTNGEKPTVKGSVVDVMAVVVTVVAESSEPKDRGKPAGIGCTVKGEECSPDKGAATDMSKGGGQEGVADVTTVVTGVGELTRGFSSLDIHDPELHTATVLSDVTRAFSPVDVVDSTDN